MNPKLNAAFWRWFGDSVIRNADGSPMVVYHGTTSGKKFSVFDYDRAGTTHGSNFLGRDRGLYGRGFYFSMNYDVAATYMRGRKKGRVIEAYLRLERPVSLESDNLPEEFREAIDQLRASRKDITLEPISDAKYGRLESWWYYGNVAEETPVFGREYGRAQFLSSYQDAFMLLGFDGVIANENEIVVFHPSQIKSIDNDGTWDRDDPDIGSNPPEAAGFAEWLRENQDRLRIEYSVTPRGLYEVSDSAYFNIEFIPSDGEQWKPHEISSITVRISGHPQPVGGGYHAGLGYRMGESDISVHPNSEWTLEAVKSHMEEIRVRNDADDPDIGSNPPESALPAGFDGFDIPDEPSRPMTRMDLMRRGLFLNSKAGDELKVDRVSFVIVRVLSPHEVMAQKIGAKRKMFNIWQQDTVTVREQKGSIDTTMAMPVVLEDSFESVGDSMGLDLSIGSNPSDFWTGDQLSRDVRGNVFELPAGTLLYHGSPEPYASQIREHGKLTWGHPHKPSGGSLNEGGLIFFTTDRRVADIYARRSEIGRGIEGSGSVFVYRLSNPILVADYYMRLNQEQADILNRTIPLPDYKSLREGDQLRAAAYRAHELERVRDEYPSYRTEGGEMMVIWPTILKALGFDAYAYENNQIAIPAEEARIIAGNPAGKEGRRR